MLLDRTDHNRFAGQLSRRLTPAPEPVPTARTIDAGHNNPPSRLEYAADAFTELSAFLKDKPVIQSEHEARAGVALKERTLVAIKEARNERETKTSPLRERLNAIFSAYELVKDKGPLETAYGILRKRLTTYATAIEDARIAEANRLRLEAEERERIAREAEAAEAAAIAGADVGECTDVGAAIEQADVAFSSFRRADKQAAIAEKNVPVRFASALGGRSQAMRNVEVLMLDNIDAAIKVLGITDKIRDAVLSSARDFRKEFDELPAGIIATYERSL